MVTYSQMAALKMVNKTESYVDFYQDPNKFGTELEREEETIRILEINKSKEFIQAVFKFIGFFSREDDKKIVSTFARRVEQKIHDFNQYDNFLDFLTSRNTYKTKPEPIVEQSSIVTLDDKSLIEQEIQRIPQIKDDNEFFKEIFNILKINAKDTLVIKKILNDSAVINRVNSINNLSSLADLIFENQNLLQYFLIQKFIAKLCVRLQSLLTINYLCEKKESNKFFDEDKLIKLLTCPSLPQALYNPLKAIKCFNIKKSELNNENFRDQNVLLQAIDVGKEIDGCECRYRGIRLWIHQPKWQGEGCARDLLSKVLKEFQSGRRNFIFSPVDDVPYQNYKEVMLYIIRSLREDRESYYKEHPIEQTEYRKKAATFEEKDSVGHEEDIFEFEWLSQHIVSLEQEIEKSQTDDEIKVCINKFSKYYSKLPNYSMYLTVCTCIDPRVFLHNQSSSYKPVMYHGIPKKLKQLANMKEYNENDTLSDVLNTFAQLSNVKYHPQEIQDKLDRLKEIYELIVKDPINKEYKEQFLSLWSTIPQKEKLLQNNIKKYTSRITTLSEFISFIEGKISHENGFALKFDEIKAAAKSRIMVPFPDLIQKLNAFMQIIKNNHDQKNSIGLIEQKCEVLFALKNYIKSAILPCDTLHASSVQIVNDAFEALEQIELILANDLLQENTSSPEIFKLISRIAISQNFLKTPFENVEQLVKVLEQERSNKMLGYKNLRQQLLNSPPLLSLIEENGMSVDSAIQIIMGSVNTDLAPILDKLINRPNKKNVLSGMATRETNVLAKVRFITQDRDFEPAKLGEILVIQNVSPEVHKYANAAAIISAQGGIFSHAAITFDELGIPALIGCDIQSLAQYNGKFIHLGLSSEPTITELPENAVTVVESLSQLKLETAAEIEELPKDIGALVADSFYKAIFDKLSAKEIAPFMVNPYAKNYFSKEREAVKTLEKRLCKAENQLEKNYLFAKLTKKLNKLVEIARESTLDRKEQENLLLEINRRYSSFELKGVSFGKSGKKENLDRLKDILPNIKLKHFKKLNIPSYCSFDAETLIWSRYPELKKQILSLLEKDIEIAEKSRQICNLISDVQFDESFLKEIDFQSDLIVRSSAQLEDQAKSAAAGIFTSIVVKEKEKIIPAFREVLLSAFSEKALHFYSQLNTQKRESIFGMTWIVQKYISNGEYSGVAFSVANEKKWNVAGLQLVKGLGGGVDGTQIPAHILVNTKDLSLDDLRLGNEKLLCTIYAIKEIASLTKKFENYFNAPVEIEFVVEANELSIVQLRPITSKLIESLEIDYSL